MGLFLWLGLEFFELKNLSEPGFIELVNLQKSRI